MLSFFFVLRLFNALVSSFFVLRLYNALVCSFLFWDYSMLLLVLFLFWDYTMLSFVCFFLFWDYTMLLLVLFLFWNYTMLLFVLFLFWIGTKRILKHKTIDWPAMDSVSFFICDLLILPGTYSKQNSFHQHSSRPSIALQCRIIT